MLDQMVEAFSRNPSDGSFAPLAYQPSTLTNICYLTDEVYFGVQTTKIGAELWTIKQAADILGTALAHVRVTVCEEVCCCPVDESVTVCISARTDIDECQDANRTATCKDCKNTPGSYKCICAAGYLLHNNILCQGSLSSISDFSINVCLRLLCYLCHSFHLSSQTCQNSITYRHTQSHYSGFLVKM